MTIEETLRANRPNLSDNSVRTYKSLIANLAKQMSVKIETPEDVISHHVAILDHIKGRSATGIKSSLSALIGLVEGSNDAKETLERFGQVMKTKMKQANEQADEQKMTDKQKKAMMSWEDILKKYHDLKKEVEPLSEEEVLSKEQFARYQMYVLLSCMVLIEPRRSLDWTEFKLRNIDESKDNFLRVVKRKPFLVFNTFKTAKEIGQQILPCPPKLYKIIMGDWIFKNKHDYLLMNTQQSNKINSTQYMKLLYGFFGSNVSTNILRHSYLKHLYDKVPSIKQMKKTAHAMGKSKITQALEYCVK
jgi:integrase